jgi:hypothetical protein
MSGAIPLFSLYAFMAWRGTAMAVDIYVSIVTGHHKEECSKTPNIHLHVQIWPSTISVGPILLLLLF